MSKDTKDTITLLRSVVEQALEALERNTIRMPVHLDCHFEAIKALRAALEQPAEQEPFAVLVRIHSWHLGTWDVGPQGNLDYGRLWADERINVYTHPQPPYDCAVKIERII